MKKGLMAIFACLIVIGGVLVFTFRGRKPFKGLAASDIVSATVLLGPPDKTFQIAETEQLVAYLNEVVIYNEDNSYTDYAGQTVIFTLTMTDGSQTKITAFNPFIVINGTGYKAEYEPCNELSKYANKLANEIRSLAYHPSH